MTGQLSGSTTWVKKLISERESVYCVIHREMLASWKMSLELNILQDVFKIINLIKGYALNSHLFMQLYEEMDTEHTQKGDDFLKVDPWPESLSFESDSRDFF